jgi:excisionase family DNA binding protein
VRSTAQKEHFIMAKPRPTAKYLTLGQAAELRNVSQRTLRRRVADGTLPAYRVGPRLIRVLADDLDKVTNRIPSGGRDG